MNHTHSFPTKNTVRETENKPNTQNNLRRETEHKTEGRSQEKASALSIQE